MEAVRLAVLLCVCLLNLTSAGCPPGTYGNLCAYTCNCLQTACNPTDGCRATTCNRGWSGPTCQKHNIALDKQTSASSSYYPPGNAVNGIKTGVSGSLTCMHTDYTDAGIKAAWWRLDLGQTTLIHDVIIYFRKQYIVRRNGIQIYIAETTTTQPAGVSCYNVTGNRNGTDIPDVLNATCSGEGRYLVLYTTTVNNEINNVSVPVMDFCEVEVDVCGNGTFGADCDNYCHCDGAVCDYVSGVCPSGVCLPGWQPNKCDTACTLGNYGRNCYQTCSDRNCKGDNSSCDSATGQCVGGCRTGWNGTDCTQKCMSTYGDDCANMCSARNCSGASSSVCDHVTGMCDKGCSPGWKDTDCTKECVQGLEYGSGCVGNCSARKCTGGSGTCPKDAGRCDSGCQLGWQGEDCARVCSLGTFGVNCTGKCGQCLDISKCHHENGSCLTGCSEGWTNHTCTQKQVDASTSDVGVIAGSVAAVIIVASIAVVVIVLLRRRSQNSKETDKHADVFQEQAATEDMEMVNPLYASAFEADEDDVEEDHNDTYYNIASAPAITLVSVEQLGERIKQLQVPVGGFQAEYQKLSTTFTRSYKDSQLEENNGKNRFLNYYPYDDTRVVLQELPDEPGSDYINASYINGYSQLKAYIASQAPNKKTLTDFWRLIWEQNCTRIVMLTNLKELGKVKCEAYWSDTKDLTVGDFNIVVTSSRERAHWVVRELQVTEKKTSTCRCFHQFHFTTWPDHGTPEETSLTEFLWLIRTTPNTQDDPLLVHCSAGIGRTGTYIAVDYLLDQALADQKVDVFGCVSVMRDQRKGMIQTKDQYTCVYTTLHEALEFGNTAMDVHEFNQNRNWKRSFKMGRMELTQLIQILNINREISRKEAKVKGRVNVNGRSDIQAVLSQSRLSMKGYLLTVAPSVTPASLFWKLTDQQESSIVIVLPGSHQSLTSFVPSPGDSLDLSPGSVRCSTDNTINPDIVLRNIHRQIDNLPPALVRVYIVNQCPVDSHSTLLELLEQVDLHTSGGGSQPVTIIYSDSGTKRGVMHCILSNIVQGLKHDRRVEIYNNMRAMAHFLDSDITQEDVALCYDVASAYVESQSVYANV
ncbi:receptor-type tyrosine-protein phosphatase alpha-like isoform X2 [Haliotis rufescens]|uniref:receptor-type tyrosine-protein phosphatase alpha-like isoform X2 n=1 Tax=Haliotis rufescens TaxID=6454 RepID=UPI00201EBE19|nr:receptor-type tyrosine-protein phosphatase alpha-like isoform X2 [Haliotis rufescens]